MKPLKLTMQAFGSYVKPGTIDFEKPEQNLFLITGDTGAGKTTIFDAIVFALYGEASSGANKKSGNELQSQYAKPDLDPFVELTFSEGDGNSRQVYTVRRTPRHIRPLKRGTGTKEEKETVSLILPDQTDFSQNKKETDEKLVEILGLTKGQFMQVAMIAQGEFMELLRAKSDEKKVIFRKLFNTEPYQKIVEELGVRRKEKQQEIAVIRTECQTEAGHIEIPEQYQRADIVRELKEKVIRSERFLVTDMEKLLEELEHLCAYLQEKQQEIKVQVQAAELERNQTQEKFAKAEQLLQAYQQLEQAKTVLDECKEQAEQIKKKEVLTRQIRSAYEIQSGFKRLQDSMQLIENSEKELQNCEQQMPELLKNVQETVKQEKTAGAKQQKQNAAYNRVAERVNQALETFQKIADVTAQIQKKEAEQKSAEQAAKKAEEKQKQLETQIQQWKAQEEEKKDTPTKLAYWENQKKEAEALAEEVKEAKKLHEELAKQKKVVKAEQKAFSEASKSYQEAHGRYENMRQIFFNMQAGLIAKEQLKPGQPCPVCGSVEHPAPCELAEEHSEITREKLDEMSLKIEKLQAEQEACASKAHAAGALADEKEQIAENAVEKLFGHMKNSLKEIPETMEFALAEAVVESSQKELELEGKQLLADVKLLKKVQNQLQNAETEKVQLEESLQKAKKYQQNVQTELESSRAVLKNLTGSLTFTSKEEAEHELESVNTAKMQAEEAYAKAAKLTERARQTLDKVQALENRYREELPKLVEARQQRQTEYAELLTERDLAEEEWQELTQTYTAKDAETFQQKINIYKEKLARTQGIYTSAKEQIGEQDKPDLEAISQKREETEDQLQNLRNKQEQWNQYTRTDCATYDILKPKMESRAQILAQHQRINELYNRLAGNVSGSRMDLETFVQRQYLEKILYAANRRFLEMSAGQFELQMYDLEKAGEGRNHGLDLMVYSAVTGKVREVRTLSGGESFMAALSLALGMADQIQESSAAIHLDVMFIDEGFGSLDEHSRNQAVRVLQEMAGGSKLIGIISHVTELKQEIDDQLIVSKDENGSHVRWQIS
ncbi:SMC family ATPase [uncultured Eubacterium sp.]|uniref:AAA family ATPase n=1 Tax=uncultured Eubacterium sp. TaxID=165185 RepID=UPI0025F5204D|nr:SMC family ATPase [uncultured Eubacterium sp.]